MKRSAPRLCAGSACTRAFTYRDRSGVAGRDRQCCADRCGESCRRLGRSADAGQSGRRRFAAGGDSDPAIPLRRAGERLRPSILPPSPPPGIARITVREPRVRILPLRGSGIITAAARLVTSDIERRGGAARLDDSGRGLDVAMAAESSDAIVAIGGTGSGRNDSQRADAYARGAPRSAWLALTPGKPLRSVLSARGRCCCCREGSMPRSRLARSRDGAARSARGRQEQRQ